MKADILKNLKETDGFVSGQELCERFSVSRTAVWKVIDALKKEGYEIEAVTRRGYRLVRCPDVLTEEALCAENRSKQMMTKVVCFPETDSTNEQLKKLAAAGAPHGTLVVADRQTAGKGRRGRTFLSPSGVSIYMSILLRPKIRVQDASMLTLVSALSVQEGILEAAGLPCEIKWPNDVIHQGKKLVGILTEMSLEEERIDYVIVGIGINVNNTAFSPEIADIAGSIYLETGKTTNRAVLIARIMECFERNYELFLKTSDLSGMRARYEALLVNKGKPVRVLDEMQPYDGISEGINDRGELLVRVGEELRHVAYGEVSVRGIYGYV